jgi:chemotaxis regulatin CheY-phosphate phosphatase CheZ
MDQNRTTEMDPASGKGKTQPRLPIDRDEGVIENLMSALILSIPVLDRIRHSIRETSHKIPRASQHLDTVTQVTQSATMGILDMVESVSKELEETLGMVNELGRRQQERLNLLSELEVAGQQLIARYPGDPLVMKLADLKGRFTGLQGDFDLREQARLVIDRMKKEMLEIAMFLQVQDITSQQIGEVGNVIESVQSQLVSILQYFDPKMDIDAVLKEAGELAHPEVRTDEHLMDAAASFTEARERQSVADAVVVEWNKQNKQ